MIFINISAPAKIFRILLNNKQLEKKYKQSHLYETDCRLQTCDTPGITDCLWQAMACESALLQNKKHRFHALPGCDAREAL